MVKDDIKDNVESEIVGGVDQGAQLVIGIFGVACET